MAAESNNTVETRLNQWSDIISDQQSSGLSVKAYCEKNGYQVNKFYYWQRKLRECAKSGNDHQKAVQSEREETTPAGWAECSVVEPEPADIGLSIQIGPYQVNISGAPDVSQLESVCRMLARLC